MSSVGSLSSTTLNTLNQSQHSTKKREKTFSELSSGKKKIDPGSLGRTEALKSQANALATENESIDRQRADLMVTQGQKMAQLEAAQQARSTAVQASSDTLSPEERDALSNQFSEQVAQSGSTTLSSSSVEHATDASQAISSADAAITELTTSLAADGTAQGNLELERESNQNLQVAFETARSNAEDTDFAKATSDAAKQAVLAKAQMIALAAGLKAEKNQSVSVKA